MHIYWEVDATPTSCVLIAKNPHAPSMQLKLRQKSCLHDKERGHMSLNVPQSIGHASFNVTDKHTGHTFSEWQVKRPPHWNSRELHWISEDHINTDGTPPSVGLIDAQRPHPRLIWLIMQVHMQKPHPHFWDWCSDTTPTFLGLMLRGHTLSRTEAPRTCQPATELLLRVMSPMGWTRWPRPPLMKLKFH